MEQSRLRATVIKDRLNVIQRMCSGIRNLPLDSFHSFTSDTRTPAAAESFLRRALEALLDLGRHLLAKGFGRAPAEYIGVARDLNEVGVLNTEERILLEKLAGYRNRLVHFYYEVNTQEIYEICRTHLSDIDLLVGAIQRWIRLHSDRIDTSL